MPQIVPNHKSFHNKHKVWLINDTFILSPPDLTYHTSIVVITSNCMKTSLAIDDTFMLSPPDLTYHFISFHFNQ